jgi:hypothetical protein
MIRSVEVPENTNNEKINENEKIIEIQEVKLAPVEGDNIYIYMYIVFFMCID